MKRYVKQPILSDGFATIVGTSGSGSCGLKLYRWKNFNVEKGKNYGNESPIADTSYN